MDTALESVIYGQCDAGSALTFPAKEHYHCSHRSVPISHPAEGRRLSWR